MRERASLHGGFIIRTVRKYRAMSQEDVCFLYGICEKTLRNWEAEKTDPHFGHVQCICEDVLHVPLLDAIGMAFDEVQRKLDEVQRKQVSA